MTPDVSPAQTRILLALTRVYQRHGRATVRAVAAEAGRSIRMTHIHLRALRRLDLVAWETGHQGTLRPLVTTVAEL